MMICVGLPKSLLSKAVNMACYDVNSSPSLITNTKISREICDRKTG